MRTEATTEIPSEHNSEVNEVTTEIAGETVSQVNEETMEATTKIPVELTSEVNEDITEIPGDSTSEDNEMRTEATTEIPSEHNSEVNEVTTEIAGETVSQVNEETMKATTKIPVELTSEVSEDITEIPSDSTSEDNEMRTEATTEIPSEHNSEVNEVTTEIAGETVSQVNEETMKATTKIPVELTSEVNEDIIEIPGDSTSEDIEMRIEATTEIPSEHNSEVNEVTTEIAGETVSQVNEETMKATTKIPVELTSEVNEDITKIPGDSTSEEDATFESVPKGQTTRKAPCITTENTLDLTPESLMNDTSQLLADFTTGAMIFKGSTQIPLKLTSKAMEQTSRLEFDFTADLTQAEREATTKTSLELTSTSNINDLIRELTSGPVTVEPTVNQAIEKITKIPLNLTSEPPETRTDLLVESHSESVTTQWMGKLSTETANAQSTEHQFDSTTALLEDGIPNKTDTWPDFTSESTVTDKTSENPKDVNNVTDELVVAKTVKTTLTRERPGVMNSVETTELPFGLTLESEDGTTASSHHTTKESYESTTFRDNSITRDGNMTTVPGDVSDYVYKMTTATDEFTNQVDETTNLTKNVTMETRTTTSQDVSDKKSYGQTVEITSTSSDPQTVSERVINYTVTENTTLEYTSHIEITTDGQYTAGLEISTPTGYTVQPENTTATQHTTNLENTTSEEFSVSSGIISINRTTGKYVFDSKTTSVPETTMSNNVTVDHSLVFGTSEHPRNNTTNGGITEQSEHRHGTTSETMYGSMENNTTTETSVIPETTVIPEYTSHPTGIVSTENNAENSTTADLRTTTKFTVISDNMATTEHTNLENIITTSNYVADENITNTQVFTSMENFTNADQRHTKTTQTPDVTTTSSYMIITNDNATIKHTDSVEISTVSSQTINLNIETTTDNSINQDNVTTADSTSNQHNTSTDGYLFHLENTTIVINGHKATSSEQLEKNTVVDYTSNIENTTDSKKKDNTDIFTIKESEIPSTAGTDLENAWNTDSTNNPKNTITGESTVNPDNTANIYTKYTDDPKTTADMGFTIHLENVSTDSERVSNPVTGLSNELENTTSGKITDDSVNITATIHPTYFGSVTTVKNGGDNGDYGISTRTLGETTPGYSNLPDNTALTDFITAETRHENNTLEDITGTSDKNASYKVPEDANLTMEDYVTETDSGIQETTTQQIGSRETNASSPESVSFANRSPSQVPVTSNDEENIIDISMTTTKDLDVKTKESTSAHLSITTQTDFVTETTEQNSAPPTQDVADNILSTTGDVIPEITPDDEHSTSLSSTVNISETFSSTVSLTTESFESSGSHDAISTDRSTITPNDIHTVTANYVTNVTQKGDAVVTPDDFETISPNDVEMITSNKFNTVTLNDAETFRPNDVSTFKTKDVGSITQNSIVTATPDDVYTITPTEFNTTVTPDDVTTFHPANNDDATPDDAETVIPNDVETSTSNDAIQNIVETITPDDTETVSLDGVTVSPHDVAATNPHKAESMTPIITKTITSNDALIITTDTAKGTNDVPTATADDIDIITLSNFNTINDVGTFKPHDVSTVTRNDFVTGTPKNIGYVTPDDVDIKGPDDVETVTSEDKNVEASTPTFGTNKTSISEQNDNISDPNVNMTSEAAADLLQMSFPPTTIVDSENVTENATIADLTSDRTDIYHEDTTIETSQFNVATESTTKIPDKETVTIVTDVISTERSTADNCNCTNKKFTTETGSPKSIYSVLADATDDTTKASELQTDFETSPNISESISASTSSAVPIDSRHDNTEFSTSEGFLEMLSRTTMSSTISTSSTSTNAATPSAASVDKTSSNRIDQTNIDFISELPTSFENITFSTTAPSSNKLDTSSLESQTTSVGVMKTTTIASVITSENTDDDSSKTTSASVPKSTFRKLFTSLNGTSHEFDRMTTGLTTVFDADGLSAKASTTMGDITTKERSKEISETPNSE